MPGPQAPTPGVVPARPALERLIRFRAVGAAPSDKHIDYTSGGTDAVGVWQQAIDEVVSDVGHSPAPRSLHTPGYLGGRSCGGGPVGEPLFDDMTGPADRVRAQP